MGWRVSVRDFSASLIVGLLLVLTGASQTLAQKSLPTSAAVEPESITASKARPATAEKLTDPPKANEHVIFVDKNGEVVRLTAGGQIGEYLKWREQLLRGTDDNRPGYYVAAITLTGEVNAGRTMATLDASIEVFVRDGIDQVDVPLRLNEATLLRRRQSASGPVEFLPPDRSSGMKCRIAESGQHRIDLQLSVPVRKSGNSYRMQLSLPGTAQSSLRLVVPGDVIAIRPDQLADIEVETLPNARSALIVHGLGAALDLPWQVVNTQPEEKTAIQVETLMAVDAGVDGVAIEAVQTITATSGSFSSVKVEVPQGFNAFSISSPTHDSIQTTDLQTSPVVISLQESTAGPLRLKWLLASDAKASVNRFSISNFAVENATREEMLFGIRLSEGFRLSQLTPRPQQVQRFSTSLFRKKVEAQFDPQIEFHQAYRLPGRNSSIQFQLERIEASYRVSPTYELLFHEAAAELSARFEIIVYRGSLDHVRLRWPGRVSEEWQQIEVVEPAERVQIVGGTGGPGEPLKPATGSNPLPMKDEIELHFAEPLNRTHGAVTVEIRARRPVQLGEEAFLISIPTADSESKPVSHLKVLNASNVESTIAAAGDTELRFVSDGDQIGAVETAELPLNLLPRYIESTSPRLTFRATVTTHDQVVTSSSGVVFKLSEDQIAVEQKLRYSVMYKELDRLRILVPGTIRPDAFRLLASDGTSSVPLTAEVGGLEIDGVRQIRVNLPAPKIGRFDILCSYLVPVDSVFVSSGVADIEVSLLQPAEIQSETTRVEIRSPGNVGVQLRGEQWTQELTLSSAPSWITPGTVRNVSLKLEAAPERATQNFVVRRSALRTRFQNGAAARTTGVYLIDGDISFLTVTLPANTDHSSLSVWWDGQPLTDESLVSSEVKGKTADVRILLDDQPRRDQHTLTLEFDISWSGGFSGFNELHTSAPRFASDVWLADTIWEIVLPVDQHLFVYPNNYTPAFSWQRQALVWQRRPIDLGISLNDWLLADAEPDLVTSLQTQLQTLQFDPLASLPYGNSYLFNAFGHQQEVRFQTMSEPAIILTGAGLTLAIGLVLLRIPATRHVLTVLVVGFGLSLAGLWHLEAVQLLLQPAVFGLILAVIASVIESRVKRRQRASLVTFSSPSDFLVQGSSREEIIHDASNELNERPA